MCTAAIRKTITKARKLKATRQVNNALVTRDSLNNSEVLQLSIQSEGEVYREKEKCTGTYAVLAFNTDSTLAIVNVKKQVPFRTTVMRAYYADDSIENTCVEWE